MFIFKAGDHYPVTTFTSIILIATRANLIDFFQRVIKITFVNNTEDQLKKLQQQNNNPPKWFYSGITVCLAQEVYLMLNE